MSQQDLEKLVYAFVFSRLEYCNSLSTSLCKKINTTVAADSSLKRRKWNTSPDFSEPCTNFVLCIK